MKPFQLGAVAASSLALGGAAAISLGTSLWKRTTARAVATLTSQRPANAGPSTFSLGQVQALPDPVARYFRFALAPGQPLIQHARLKQTGTMRSGADKPWAHFSAVEHFSVRPPAFVWDASMSIAPLVSVRVRDSYLRGEGASEAKVAGLISVGAIRGTPEAASASLVRYLAEAPWLPTVLLPNGNLTWSPIDNNAARATLTDETTSVSIDVQFGAYGEIVSVSAMRYRDMNGVPVLTPWHGHYRNYTSLRGMMIPMAADVEWVVGEGAVTVWRGEITATDYTFAA